MLMINEANFNAEVKESSIPVIIDYYADWCGPCKMIAPVFESLSKKMTDVKFAKLNVDENTQLAHDQGVLGIPCMIIYRKGEEVDRIVGYQPEDQLKAKIEKALAK